MAAWLNGLARHSRQLSEEGYGLIQVFAREGDAAESCGSTVLVGHRWSGEFHQLVADPEERHVDRRALTVGVSVSSSLEAGLVECGDRSRGA